MACRCERSADQAVGHAQQKPKPFKWTKSADRILASVKRFYAEGSWSMGEL